MSERYGCEQLERDAAERAAGVLSGEARAQAEAHLAECDHCRRLVAELAAVADTLLALAPEDEPAADFDATVLRRIHSARARRRPWRVVAIAAAVALLSGIGVGALVTRQGPRDIAASASLRAGDGAGVGRAYLHRGSSPWVLVDVRDLDHSGMYDLTLVTADGATLPVGHINVVNGAGVAAVQVPASVRGRPKAVRMTTGAPGAAGWYKCEAIF